MARLVSNLHKIAKAIGPEAEKALLQTGADIVDILHQPGFTPRDTGKLQDSYGAVPVTSSHVIVGTDVEYAPFVEHGTVNSPAQPHLTPAFEQNVVIFKERLKQAANNAAT